MKPATAWFLRHFPYSVLVKNQSLFLKLSMFIFVSTVLLAVFYIDDVHTPVLVSFSIAFSLVFISSYLPRKENKITSLVTQTGALELLDISPLPIFTYEKREADIHIRFANLACHKMLADGSKSLIDKPISHLVMLEDEDEMVAVCLETLESSNVGDNRTFYIRSRSSSGSITKLLCLTSQIKWLDQHIGICFLFDISESESQYADMQAHMHEGYMSTLVAGIVHDFRNVLTSIIGTAEALQFSVKDENTTKQLDVIIDASERGANTITELLQLSSGKYTKKGYVNKHITSDLKSIFSLLRLQLPVHVRLYYSLDKDIPDIKITTTELEQILMNLVNNASQAMDKDHGTIMIHATHSASTTGCAKTESLQITVSDNGKGIAEADLSKVTKNFWTSRKDEGGTGLGLAMVKRIVTNLGGKLEITSEVSIGTKVCVCFPINTQDNAATPADEPSTTTAPTGVFHAQPCTILLVDDQPSVLHVQQMLLEAMGHTVITALNGQAALIAFEKEKESIQMLITDFKMPDMDGIDLAEKLKEKHPNLPLLMVTGYGEKSKTKLADKLNMTIITKPTNLAKFSKAVAETQLKHPNIFS